MTLPIPAVGGFQCPPFRPERLTTTASASQAKTEWVELYSTPCHFTLPTFLSVMKDLTLHPERNSSLILRADPLPPLAHTSSSAPSNQLDATDQDDLWRGLGIEESRLEKQEEIRVRLMPKQPKRDGRLDQRTVFFRSGERVEHPHEARMVAGGSAGADSVESEKEVALVVCIPLVKDVADVPFYHPPVRAIAFRYEGVGPSDENRELVDQLEGVHLDSGETDDRIPVKGSIKISYLPFDGASTRSVGSSHSSTLLPPAAAQRSIRKRSPLAGPATDSTNDARPAADVNHHSDSLPEADGVTEQRLTRTCLALLERVYKHGYGATLGYKKRVEHDVSSLAWKVSDDRC